MTDNDLDNLYKAAVGVSHFAGLREVYDSGYEAGLNATPTPITPDASLTQSVPSADVTVTAV